MFYLSLLLIVLLGYLAQTTGLCMVRGVKEARKGQPMFLLSIVFSGSFSWLAIGLAHLFGSTSQFTAYSPNGSFAIGGLLFGLGAAFNNGCGVSTISRLARGHLLMVGTILGWLVSWILFTELMTATRLEAVEVPKTVRYLILVVISVFISLYFLTCSNKQKRLWLSMLGIGVMAGFIFIFESHWTPSALLKDVSLTVWQDSKLNWPINERFFLIGALIAGMVIAAIYTRSFSLNKGSVKGILGHFSAGLLMGLGAVMATGGNDTQLLVALPALSPAGVVAIVCIVIGIYLGIRIKLHFNGQR